MHVHECKQIQAVCLLQTKIKINVTFMPVSLTQKLIISCGLQHSK